MKKILLAATLIVALVSSASAEFSKENRKAVKALKEAFSNSKSLSWSSNDNYKSTSMLINGQNVSSFYQHDDELIGFSISIKPEDLPQMAKDASAKKFAEYSIKEAILFYDSYGNSNYFTYQVNGKKHIIVKINTVGKASYYGIMPLQNAPMR